MTATQVTHRTSRRRAERFSIPADDLALLDLPEAQPIIARVAANTDPCDPHRMEHVLRVASICVRAKKHPRNIFAKATL